MRRLHPHPGYQIYQSAPPRMIDLTGVFNLLTFVFLYQTQIKTQIKSYKNLFTPYFQESKNDH